MTATAMPRVLTFVNHPPIRIADRDAAFVVWSAGWDFGHFDLNGYTTKKGKTIYWFSRNSGRSYNGRDPETERTYCPTVADIRNHFADLNQLDTYHAEVEATIDPAAIIDVDAIA